MESDVSGFASMEGKGAISPSIYLISREKEKRVAQNRKSFEFSTQNGKRGSICGIHGVLGRADAIRGRRVFYKQGGAFLVSCNSLPISSIARAMRSPAALASASDPKPKRWYGIDLP
jgi:hypothetical protein